MFAGMKKNLVILATCAMGAVALASPVAAQEVPFTSGDFWQVTGIHLKDGASLKYASFLAGDWRANQEFAKSKGWIKNYMVLANPYPRKGEPDVYLITVSENIPSGAESEKRDAEYYAWRKTTAARMEEESGNRAEFREVGSSSLLQEMKFK
jgi:hypothetical protein